MAGAIVGGIMALIGSFILYMQTGGFGGTLFFGVQDISVGDYVYAWLIPIFGLLGLILAPIAFATQNKGIASATLVMGLLTFLIALLLPIHIGLSGGGSIVDGFFFSMGTFAQYYMGGFMAISGGISILSGGASLGGAIKRAHPPRQQYPPQQYPPQQYPPRY